MSADVENREVFDVNPKTMPVPEDGKAAAVPAKVSIIVKLPLTTVPHACDPWTGNVNPKFGVV